MASQLPTAVEEVPMHIHGSQMNSSAINPYASADRAAASARAADVRKRLMKTAATDGIDDPEQTLMIGKWLGGAQGRTDEDTEYHTSAGKDSDFD
jgi:hypothetical protein